MKYRAIIYCCLFLIVTCLAHAMDNLNPNVFSIEGCPWKLIKEFDTYDVGQNGIKSAYFDKQSNLIMCDGFNIAKIKQETGYSSYLPLNHFVTGRWPIFKSGVLIHDTGFVAFATEKIIVNTEYQINFERCTSKLTKKLDEGISELPSFDAQGIPNYLVFGSDCGLAPMHFDSEEKYFAISNKNLVGICKILPNPDGSREYAAKFDCNFPVIGLCFHPSKKIMAAATKLKVHVYDVDAKKELFAKAFTKVIHSICFNSNNHLAVIADDIIQIIPLDNLKLQKTIICNLPASQFYNLSACFHPTHENIIAVTSTDNQLRIMDTNSGTAIQQLPYKFNPLPLQCFSPNGHYLAILDKDQMQCFSPNGHNLAILDKDQIKIYQQQPIVPANIQ